MQCCGGRGRGGERTPGGILFAVCGRTDYSSINTIDYGRRADPRPINHKTIIFEINFFHANNHMFLTTLSFLRGVCGVIRINGYKQLAKRVD